ncbi:MAG: hypothetical protein OXE17_11075 [Chloroflexi bacterium]|nr:hypothetical protein [Chloroflexota bacterium]
MIYGYNPTYFLGFFFIISHFLETYTQEIVQSLWEAGGLTYGFTLDNFGNSVFIDWMQV